MITARGRCFFRFFILFLFIEIIRFCPDSIRSCVAGIKKETNTFKKRNILFNKKKKRFAVIAKVSRDADIWRKKLWITEARLKGPPGTAWNAVMRYVTAGLTKSSAAMTAGTAITTIWRKWEWPSAERSWPCWHEITMYLMKFCARGRLLWIWWMQWQWDSFPA